MKKSQSALLPTEDSSLSFDMTNWKWQNHLLFESEILHLFYHKIDGEVNNCCITKDGRIFFDFLIEEGNYAEVVTADEHADADKKIEGEINNFSTDFEKSELAFIIHTIDYNPHITMIYNGELIREDGILNQIDIRYGYNTLSIVPI